MCKNTTLAHRMRMRTRARIRIRLCIRWILVIIIFMIINVMSQDKECYDESECVGETIIETDFRIECFGFESCSTSSTSLSNLGSDAFIYLREILCDGKRSCEECTYLISDVDTSIGGYLGLSRANYVLETGNLNCYDEGSCFDINVHVQIMIILQMLLQMLLI